MILLPMSIFIVDRWEKNAMKAKFAFLEKKVHRG